MSRVRILVCNIGHQEIDLIIRTGAGAEFIARPTSVALGSVTRCLVETLVRLEPTSAFRASVSLSAPFPIGSKTKNRRLKLTKSQAEALNASGGDVVGLEFRNIAAVVNRWSSNLEVDDSGKIFLVTSEPDDSSLSGTATEASGQLIQQFLKLTLKNVEIEVLPPLREDPFRFSSMTRHIRDTVRAAVDASISDHVGGGYEDWAKDIDLTLSASTGTTPMISALHEAFRAFSPQFAHVPKARQRPEGDDLPEVEVYSFREIAHRDAIPAEALSPDERSLVDAMSAWRDEFRAAERQPGHELSSFWLRKGKKPVLAIVAVSTGDGLEFHRACNLEVSLPTGSLCAERNAIGSALAANPALTRADIRMVAVLSLPGVGERGGEHMNPLGPCGTCMEWLRKVAQATPNVRILTFDDLNCTRVYVDRVN